MMRARLQFTPAAEGHGLWPWMNAPAFGRDVAPLGRKVGATGFARGAPLVFPYFPGEKEYSESYDKDQTDYHAKRDPGHIGAPGQE
jgi:hypothetical protein